MDIHMEGAQLLSLIFDKFPEQIWNYGPCLKKHIFYLFIFFWGGGRRGECFTNTRSRSQSNCIVNNN